MSLPSDIVTLAFFFFFVSHVFAELTWRASAGDNVAPSRCIRRRRRHGTSSVKKRINLHFESGRCGTPCRERPGLRKITNLNIYIYKCIFRRDTCCRVASALEAGDVSVYVNYQNVQLPSKMTEPLPF